MTSLDSVVRDRCVYMAWTIAKAQSKLGTLTFGQMSDLLLDNWSFLVDSQDAKRWLALMFAEGFIA